MDGCSTLGITLIVVLFIMFVVYLVTPNRKSVR